jgi:hypothetical protein
MLPRKTKYVATYNDFREFTNQAARFFIMTSLKDKIEQLVESQAAKELRRRELLPTSAGLRIRAKSRRSC